MMTASQTLETLGASNALHEARRALVEHRLLSRLRSVEDWRTFMACHVFAVWDFMSLLKRLQRDLTCVALPWMPARHPDHARFVNELVLAEESDEDGHGGFSSHFELYLQAMRDAGADSTRIDALLRRVQAGATVADALAASDTPKPIADFVLTTMNIANAGSAVEVAAAFFWGREEIIPDMFSGLLELLPHAPHTARLRHYLARHIELDADDHGPVAQAMVRGLCATAEHVTQAHATAVRVLRARAAMWDHVATLIDARNRQTAATYQAANID